MLAFSQTGAHRTFSDREANKEQRESESRHRAERAEFAVQLVCATDAFGAAVSEGVDGGEMFLVLVTNTDFTWPSR